MGFVRQECALRALAIRRHPQQRLDLRLQPVTPPPMTELTAGLYHSGTV